MKQGHPPFGVEMKITDDAGKKLPWDGKTFGRLKVRGPAVAKRYFKDDANILDGEGFFDTGDVATMDAHGYMQITDRSKESSRAASGFPRSTWRTSRSAIPRWRRPR
jgi:fatty-acyl-CoA synthase